KLKEKMPNLPIEEEGRLNDAWLRENFLMQVYSYANLKEYSKIPELPDEKKARFVKEYGLKEYDASVITSSLEMANYFDD
ncbi:hypothetical protein ACP0F0_27870, partial [Escherichia coli]